MQTPDAYSRMAPRVTIRRLPLSAFAFPALIGGLIALIVVLTVSTLVSAREHRRTAERLIREYSALAAWQYSRHVREYVRSHFHMSVRPVVHAAGPSDRLDAAALVRGVKGCQCGFKQEALYSFRFDEETQTVTTSVPISKDDEAQLIRLAAVTGQFEPDEDGHRGGTVLSLVGHVPRVAVLVTAAPGETRVVFGLIADVAHFQADFGRAAREETILPTALTRGLSTEGALRLEVRHPIVGSIYANHSAADVAGILAADTLRGDLGGLIVSAHLQPAFASLLLGGAIPREPLMRLAFVVGLALLLAGTALFHHYRMKEVSRLREDFVASVSHELRTPLTQIAMFSETLQLGRHRTKAEHDYALGVIVRETRRLGTLVDGILSFTRVRRGLVERQRCDLSAELQDIVKSFTPLADKAGASVHLVAPRGMVAWSDSAAFRQIMLNVLDNAVKYGPSGGRVDVAVVRRDAWIMVTVADEGPGIPPGERSRVFEAFHRLVTPGDASATGTGLGLTVVAELAQALGGSVEIATGREGAGRPPGTEVRVMLMAVDIGSAEGRQEAPALVGVS